MYIIITILILLIARLAYFYICWKRSVVVSGKDYSLQYSDEGLSDLQALLFRVYARNIYDGDPRGWAIKYSEILLNDLKQPLPKKWLRAKDVPEIKLESGLNNLSQWVLIVEDGNSFRFVTRDHIEDTDRLCVPYVTIRSDLSKRHE